MLSSPLLGKSSIDCRLVLLTMCKENGIKLLGRRLLLLKYRPQSFTKASKGKPPENFTKVGKEARDLY